MSEHAPRSREIALETGLRYHVLEWGNVSAASEVIMLVHGFLDMSAGWSATVRAGLGERAFASGRAIVAPDMRGHGDSDRIGAGGYYHFADYLADLDALIGCYGEAPLSLVGHSMGGSITSYYAGCFPQRVGKLVLMEGMGPPEPPPGAAKRISGWIAAWRKARERAPRRYATIEDAASRLRKHDPLLSDELSLELAAAGTRATDDGQREFKHDPLHVTLGPYPFRVDVAAELWSEITCPVLAIEGELSTFRQQRAEADRRYAHIADLRRETLAGAGHMMQRHQPDALSRILTEFLITETG